MSRLAVAAVTVAVIVTTGLIYQSSLNRQSTPDREQILALLESAQNAVERTNARETMAVVSRNYKDSIGLTYPALRLRVADALRSGVHPDVVMEDVHINVNGNQARVDLHVRVVDRREHDSVLINSDFALILHKERLRKYLIFSTQQWQVVSVDGLGRLIDSY